MAKQKEGIISFDLDTAPPTLVPLTAKDLEFLTQRNETLTNLLVRMLHTTGQITANGTHSKNRCYDCALSYNHDQNTVLCPCVCHEARHYITSVANE